MPKHIATLVIILLLAVIGYLLWRGPQAPPAPPAIGGLPGPERRPASDPTGIPGRGPAEAGGANAGRRISSGSRTRRGLVLGFRHNAHLDINAIQLRTADDGDISVDFRPHTARTVMDHAAVGDSVEVNIDSHPNDESIVYELHRLRNLRTGLEADLAALPPPPDIPPDFRAENFTLRHPVLLTDSYGGIDGLRSGKLLFHFKPGLVEDISGLIKGAGAITLTAVRRSGQFGFVNINQDTVYIVLTVTIDQKTFLVR